MTENKINLEDVIQVCIGSTILALPIAFTEEAWKLSQSLPQFKVILIIFTSLLFNACFIYYGVYEGNISSKKTTFVIRIFVNYFLTLLTVLYLIWLINTIQLGANIEEIFYKVILISFPASLSGAILDSFDKE